MSYLEISALLSGGLFVAIAVGVAARRGQWLRMPLARFRQDFKRIVLAADVLQPLLLIATALLLGSFGLNAAEPVRLLTLLSIGVFAIILAVSLAVLVPLQRKIIVTPDREKEALERMRATWTTGHMGRAVLSVVAFGLLIAAVVV